MNIGNFGPQEDAPSLDPAILSNNDNPAISINEYSNYPQPRDNQNFMVAPGS